MGNNIVSIYQHKKTSNRTKLNPVIFVCHFSFLSDKTYQTVGQLSSNISEDFAKTDQSVNYRHSSVNTDMLPMVQYCILPRYDTVLTYSHSQDTSKQKVNKPSIFKMVSVSLFNAILISLSSGTFSFLLNSSVKYLLPS